jgi:hypothetical protein
VGPNIGVFTQKIDFFQILGKNIRGDPYVFFRILGKIRSDITIFRPIRSGGGGDSLPPLAHVCPVL